MSSKTKKSKKKSKSFSDVTKKRDTTTNKKLYTHFSPEEIAEIKSVMKMKDVTGVPVLLPATFLHKFELVKNLIKDGHNVNQTGQNNMTALMWAVKYKYLDLIEFLISNGADVGIKTDSGDNAIILALENKIWDESSMITFWKSIKRGSIDINFTNKNGHNILHMCVRRDWEQLLKLVLTEKPNVDSGNSNGVTPLMLACFRNNLNIIEILIKAGAEIIKEDHHERTTLCYAICSETKTNSKSPFLATEKIVKELRKKRLLDDYLKSRFNLLVTNLKKVDIPCATSEMLMKILHYSIQFIQESVCVLLECDLFAQMLDVIKTLLDRPGSVKFFLEICQEILFYNEDSIGFRQEVQEKILEKFFCLVELLFEISKTHLSAFDVILLAFEERDQWRKILHTNIDLIVLNSNNLHGDPRNKILKNKKRRLKKFLEESQLLVQVESFEVDEKKEGFKKTRRRGKVPKNKIAKRNLDKSPKFSKSENSLEPEFMTREQFVVGNPIATSFQHLLNASNSSCNLQVPEEIQPKWKKQILNLANFHFNLLSIDKERLQLSINHLKESSKSGKFDPTINRSMNIVLDYLKQLLQIIVQKYQKHWKNDKETGTCNCTEHNEHVPWSITAHLTKIETKETQILKDLQQSFEDFTKSLKDLAHKDVNACLKSFNTIESALLQFEIRGIKLLAYISNLETFSLKFTTTNPEIEKNHIVSYVQNVVNGTEDVRPDVSIEILEECDDVSFAETYKSETPIELYYKEMALVPKIENKKKRNKIEAKLNTIANGFHLINSTMAICGDDDSRHQKIYCITDLNYPMRKSQKNVQYPAISEFMPKRLKSQISSLQCGINYQKFLNGAIRIATKEQRLNYIISAGTNFSAVELGLDIHNQPLAVKRIPRESWVGKIIKTLVEPLMGLMGSNILHYFACEYESNELILVTPLCKWTMAQYVQLLRQSSAATMPGLSIIQIVKQFLDGLMVLHRCEIPIVHGNLKPSNIFIDFNGLVKIAEFGIHKALYKIIEAPKGSLIWFSKETLYIYRNSSIMECSLKSDIQVAGMLMYFILTCGKHPFGDDSDEILKNILRGVPKLCAKNSDLKNLLLWMMTSDFDERPTIEQVLSHPFFWSPAKKWSLVLVCCGVNQNGYLLPMNIDKLHRSIDSFSEAYIKLDWYEPIKNRFPQISLTESNTLVGFLKCLKNCYEHKNDLSLSDTEMSCNILSLFPMLPVSLYRILQNTNWFKHSIFFPFSEVF